MTIRFRLFFFNENIHLTRSSNRRTFAPVVDFSKAQTWKERLTDAVLNVAQLQDEMTIEEFTEWLIALFSGKADQLRGNQDMPRKVKPVAMSADRNERLTRWWQLQQQLKEIQNEENQLRQAIVLDLFDPNKLEGVQSVDIGNGYRLKATKEINISATNESGQTEQLCGFIHNIDPGLAKGLVKWKPDVSKKVYREVLALTDQHPELKVPFAAAITAKPGMPTLELEAPKAEAAPVVESGVPQDNGQIITDGSEITW